MTRPRSTSPDACHHATVWAAVARAGLPDTLTVPATPTPSVTPAQQPTRPSPHLTRRGRLVAVLAAVLAAGTVTACLPLSTPQRVTVERLEDGSSVVWRDGIPSPVPNDPACDC